MFCLTSCAIGQIPKVVSFADVEIWLFLNGIFGGHMVILGPYFKVSDFLTVGADFSVIHLDSPCELLPSVLGYREALHCPRLLQWGLYVIWWKGLILPLCQDDHLSWPTLLQGFCSMLSTMWGAVGARSVHRPQLGSQNTAWGRG